MSMDPLRQEMVSEPAPPTVHWRWLGRVPYDEALVLQEAHRDRLLSTDDGSNTIFALEHPPTITIGRSGSRENILAAPEFLDSQGFAIREVDRGGDVTYHGPGQLVLYPILRLGAFGNDVGRYVRMLEETVIRALAEGGIHAERNEGLPGVWVGKTKICAVGVRMRKRRDGEFVTSHGIALNLSTDLTHFETIVPCGLRDRGVTSVEVLMGHAVDFEEWTLRLKVAFGEVFKVHFT